LTAIGVTPDNKEAINDIVANIRKAAPKAARWQFIAEVSHTVKGTTMKGIEERERHVLVVGGAGYVGNVLMRRLLDCGYRVRCFDALLYPTGETIAPLLDHPRFSFVYGDLRNMKDLDGSISGITDVVLLAALVGDPISKKYPDLTREINLNASSHFFSSLNGRGLRNFIFTSTCSNYGVAQGNELVSETAPLNPKSVYAETKVEMEKFILKNASSVDFSSTILRIATAFGFSPRMRFDLTISEFSRELALGRRLSVYDATTWRPYCHVLDISEAIMLVLDAPTEKVSGEVFNVGANENNFTKRMIIEAIKKHVPDAIISYEKGGFDMRDYRVSFNKIHTTLGFKPDYLVPEAIEKIIQCVKAGLFADTEARKEFYGNYAVRSDLLMASKSRFRAELCEVQI
jgi:nucleoside-diphosphate-sugar epimerase